MSVRISSRHEKIGVLAYEQEKAAPEFTRSETTEDG